MDKGSNTIVFVNEIKNFWGKIAVFPKIMTISTHLAISNSMPSFVPKYWLNWQILVAVFNEFRRPLKCTYLFTLACSLGAPDLNRVDTLNSDVVFDVIARFAMLATIFYSHQKGSKLWQQEELIISDICYLAAQITSFIALYVCSVIDSVFGRQLIFVLPFPTNHKSHIKQKKRTCCLVNHFIGNAHDHPLSSLKFVSIEQVSIKTEKFLEQREGYWQAQLWTYGFNVKTECNSGRRREFLS